MGFIVVQVNKLHSAGVASRIDTTMEKLMKPDTGAVALIQSADAIVFHNNAAVDFQDRPHGFSIENFVKYGLGDSGKTPHMGIICLNSRLTEVMGVKVEELVWPTTVCNGVRLKYPSGKEFSLASFTCPGKTMAQSGGIDLSYHYRSCFNESIFGSKKIHLLMGYSDEISTGLRGFDNDEGKKAQFFVDDFRTVKHFELLNLTTGVHNKDCIFIDHDSWKLVPLYSSHSFKVERNEIFYCCMVDIAEVQGHYGATVAN